MMPLPGPYKVNRPVCVQFAAITADRALTKVNPHSRRFV